mmetsp:Transcript_44614/g.105782  ORF Transcript_44614/g.105782 Transcript_44614/m.105782 type:complete len:150 (+) Transcript_44614:25-474(+)
MWVRQLATASSKLRAVSVSATGPHGWNASRPLWPWRFCKSMIDGADDDVDCLHLFGLSPGQSLTEQELRGEYLRLAKLYHPDTAAANAKGDFVLERDLSNAAVLSGKKFQQLRMCFERLSAKELLSETDLPDYLKDLKASFHKSKDPFP